MSDELRAAAALERAFGRTGALAFSVSPLGGVVAVLTAAKGARAVIALQGAQVLSYVPASGERDVLWCSPRSRLGTGKPVRGGVPICWPWFGAHADAAAKRPAHGFVRAAKWSVTGAGFETETTSLTFEYEPSMDQLAMIGAQLTARLRVTLGAALDIELETINSGTETFTLSQALHTYLAVGDIGRVRIHGMEGLTYYDQLTGRDVVQSGPIAIEQETDRIYRDTAGHAVTIDDASLGRSIRISSAGSASIVIWNPWREKAMRLGDMEPEGYRTMLCAESANVAPNNTVRVEPGSTHTMACRITSETN